MYKLILETKQSRKQCNVHKLGAPRFCTTY